MEKNWRKGGEAGLSIGVTPGTRNLNSKKRYVPSRGDKGAETESYTRKTHIKTAVLDQERWKWFEYGAQGDVPGAHLTSW